MPLNTSTFARSWWITCRAGSTIDGRTTSARELVLKSSSGQLQELRRQFWSDAFVFMLEKDEGVFPFLILHPLHPVFEVLIGISSAAQPQITPISRRRDGRQRLFVRIGNHQRTVLDLQQLKHLVIEPGLVTKLEGGSCLLW